MNTLYFAFIISILCAVLSYETASRIADGPWIIDREEIKELKKSLRLIDPTFSGKYVITLDEHHKYAYFTSLSPFYYKVKTHEDESYRIIPFTTLSSKLKRCFKLSEERSISPEYYTEKPFFSTKHVEKTKTEFVSLLFPKVNKSFEEVKKKKYKLE